MDIPPTILTAAGVKVPQYMRGNPLQKLASNEKFDWTEEVFLQISESQCGRAIRTHRWKYSVKSPDKGPNDPCSDVYKEDFLYNLENDPHELNNLVSDPAFVSIRKKMSERLKKRMVQAGEKEPVIIPA